MTEDNVLWPEFKRMWACTCVKSREPRDHLPGCSLWLSWEFENEQAIWDYDSWSLIDDEGTTDMGEPHDEACTCHVCLTAIWDELVEDIDETEAMEYAVTPFKMPPPKSPGVNLAKCKCAANYAGTPQYPHSIHCPLDSEYEEEVRTCKCSNTYKATEKWPHAPSCPLDSDYDNWKKRQTENKKWQGTYMKCRHYQIEFELSEGVHVYASSQHSDRQVQNTQVPDLGVYLAGSWTPDCYAIHIGCPDYNIPRPSMTTVLQVAREAIEVAGAGGLVEVGCVGGHGRTGLFLAVLALVSAHDTGAELTGEDAIKMVRGDYCSHAIESDKQEWYIKAVAAELKGEAPPVWVEPPVVKYKYTSTSSTKAPDYIPCQYPDCKYTFDKRFHDKFCVTHRDETDHVIRVCTEEGCERSLAAGNPTDKCFNHRTDKMTAKCGQCQKEVYAMPEWEQWTHVEHQASFDYHKVPNKKKKPRTKKEGAA